MGAIPIQTIVHTHAHTHVLYIIILFVISVHEQIISTLCRESSSFIFALVFQDLVSLHNNLSVLELHL